MSPLIKGLMSQVRSFFMLPHQSLIGGDRVIQHTNMIEIKPITTAEQDVLLENKLDERLKFNLLTEPGNAKFQENRVLTASMCAADWKFFVNNFCWLQDPEAEDMDNKELPFLLWDYQEKAGDEIVKAIEGGYDLPVEKCRKLGLTWLVLVIILWGWHFKQWDVLVGSRKAEEVDKRGDMGTLFQKLRFMIERLPDWLFGAKLDHYSDKVMLLIHPTHSAQIVGEGNNPDFGRSDRKKVAFLDEFTSWEQTDRQAWQGLSATVKCRIAVSTPNTRGVNCFFYQIVQDYKKKNRPVLSLSWKLNPIFARSIRPVVDRDAAFSIGEKETSPWLENEISRATDRQSVAQEILINYEASMVGKVFGEFKYEEQVRDDVHYDPNLPLYVAIDFGLDTTALLWIQPDTQNNLFYIIDEYQNDGSGDGDNIYHYINIIESKEYRTAIYYGDPHSGENRSLTSGQSNANILRRAGLIFHSQRTGVSNRITAARNILKQVRVSSKCTLTIEMFTSWQMRRSKTGAGGSVPDHSVYSHSGEAFTYFAWNYSQRGKGKAPVKRKYQQSTSGVML